MELWLAVMAIAVPSIVSILCYWVKNKIFRNTLVIIGVSIMALVAIQFATKLIGSGVAQIVIDLRNVSSIIDLNLIITVLDFLLMGYIIFIGVKFKKPIVNLLALLQLVPLAMLEGFGVFSEHEPVFVIDYLSLIMLLIVSIVGSLVIVFAMGYMKNHEEHLHLKSSKQHKFFAILFIFMTAMNGLVMSDNLLWMYFFWEVTTLCSFLLISHDGNEESIKNAFRALWINLTGGVAFLAGIIVFYSASKTLSVSELLTAVHTGDVSYLTMDLIKMLPLALGLFCFAGFTKSAQFPFQSWLLGAMVAPTPVSALLHSSTMVKAGVYLIVRFAPIMTIVGLNYMVAVAGGFTFFAGSLIAIGERNGKKVLAYSTIANLGLIICCAGIASQAAMAAAVMLMIFHAISKGLLFVCLGTIEQEIGSRDIEDMQGLMKRMPFTTIVIIIGMISMLLPPFGVLVTKWLAIECAIHLPIVLIFIVLGSAFTVVFWSKWIGIISTMSYKPKYYIEKQRISIRFSISTLLLLVIGASGFIYSVYNSMVEPYIRSITVIFRKGGFFDNKIGTLSEGISIIGDKFGIWMTNKDVCIGGFASALFFGILLAIILLMLYFVKSTKPSNICPPYLCGENTSDPRGIEFMSPTDKVDNVIVHNYYMEGFFEKNNVSMWCNLIAGAIIIIMFGVVVR